ncbi:MAG: XRE family transcriptional regulator, partial [Alphaproteobacteria bacterium]|nr:XRE family transcriptional regulator [Alphaproteobacteria bacterium]
SKNEDKERNIRRWFVEHDLVDGVIMLPDNLFYNTTAAGVIIVLSKRKPKERRGKIVLVNASAEFKKGTPKNYLNDEGIHKIASVFAAGKSVEGLAAVVTNEEAAANDFNLSPSRYVQLDGATLTMRPLGEIIAELSTLDAERIRTDADLQRVLRQLV